MNCIVFPYFNYFAGSQQLVLLLNRNKVVFLSWLFVRGEAKVSTPPVSSLASGTIATEKS